MPSSAEALANYEAEQKRLKDQHGYGDDDEAPEVNLQVPEVNPEIYKDVEPLLFQGFLTTSATINNQTFIFKSLNHHEFTRLSLFGDIKGNPIALQAYYDIFLAYGVLLVGGSNILANRDEALPELAAFFSTLHKDAKQKVIRHLSEINRRATRAVILTEAYSIENRSRLRWAQLKGLDLTSTAVTGFGGTLDLGMNWGQLTWRALNDFEDQRGVAEREWENAKFVASSMAGKGMSRIYSQDKRRRKDEQQAKVDRRERIIRHVLLNEPLDGAPSGDVHVARTVSELSTQLERDLKGEQDWHDRIITEHENRIQQGYEERFAQIQEMRAKHIEKFGDRVVIASTDIKKGFTPQEVQKRLEERRIEVARSLETQHKFAEFTDEKQAKFANKWVRKSTSQSAPSVIPAQVPTRPKAKPFNGGRS